MRKKKNNGSPVVLGLLKFSHTVCIVMKGHWNACMKARKKKELITVFHAEALSTRSCF